MINNFTPIWLSLKTATVATFFAFILGLIIAHKMLNYQGKFKGLIEVILTAPLVLPPTVIGFLLLLLLGKNGLIGQILDRFEITVIFSWYATVIAATVVAFPLMYKTALAAFAQVDANLIACARTLGASEKTIFWRIILPLAKPGVVAGTLLAYARALGEFGATLMLAGAIPGKTETIPLAIFLAAESGETDRALFLVIVMLAIAFIVMTSANYWTEKNKRNLPQFRRNSHKRLPQNFSSRLSPIPGKNSPFELIIDIEKTLADFHLKVTFHTDRTPLGILGASGSGKSTILRCIAGLETPDRGKIILNGRVLFDSNRGINLLPRDRACGFLLQNYGLFPHLTVAENIAFGIHKNKPRQAVQQAVENQLLCVNLNGMGDRYPEELSGGQQQRIALGRAMVNQPHILLLDEPFSALDTYLRDRQEKLLRQHLTHYQGITLFITHNLEEAYRVCPNLLILDNGKIIARGSKQDIFEHPPNWKTAQLTGCKNFSDAIAISPHQIQALDWDCTLEVIEPVSPMLKYVGIRAHQLLFPRSPRQSNTFPCWLAMTSETQHRITLYLKLNHPAHHPEDYHLQAEVFKDKWQELKERSFPWFIQLNELKLILLNE
ncbi:MAG: molybdate ABC transporter permease subunit [Jaaginema sp. PMC 1079.18]|nr:molybdate ABC transporter permease subunit [Jaaginema sp. PMC 1080.18]MEC4853402.1 molybdate ABC transporter permease subunit [Jaaginema sp. PMC 1079.18]MEC4866439.1 molybdate ABC transporter permease subunit [Jaaginema sp. PMC 1078.18]